MEYKDLTGLTTGQLHLLTILAGKEIGALVRPGGRPPVIGLFGSVVLGAYSLTVAVFSEEKQSSDSGQHAFVFL